MNRLKIFILLLTLFMSGCTTLGPDFNKPKKIKLPNSWDKNLTKNDDMVTEWWKIFNDKTLNELVQKTYEQNFDLRSAGLRILQAKAALGISEGLTYPQQQTISASFAGVRQNGTNFLSANTNFNVGWEMDVWGKYARNIESSEATLYASIASYDDILVSIISEVARNYISYKTAQERMAFAKSNIEIQKKVTKMTKIQFNAGNVSELDVQQAKTQLYTTQSLIPSLELNMIQSRNALAILLAILPSDVDKLLSKYPTKTSISIKNQNTYKVNSFIPTASLDNNFTINASLIQRRPDIKIAELQARAQNAKIGSTQADLYPHFSLFGSISYNTNNTSNGWISAGNAIGINAGPAFSWNIFQYDRIKNQVRIQDAKFQDALNNYNKKVLLAISEVSNAYNGYTLTKKQLQFNKKTIEATMRAFDISMTQYDNGMVTYQRLLSTVEKLIKSEDNYALIKGNIATQIVFLYKALGGGWQIRKGRAYLHNEDVKQMSKRSDWGKYLDKGSLILPTGDK